MKNDFSQIEIASINKLKNHITMKKNTGLSSIDIFNKQICEHISKDILDESDTWIQSEDIKGICYGIMRWRRCTSYLVIQISSRGIRHLCYFSDEIKHNATSFGTSMEHVKKQDVLDSMKKNLSIFLKKDTTLKTFDIKSYTYLVENIENIENIDMIFGI